MIMDIRFNILNPYVDKFIVCESLYTHSGKKKEINFDVNDYPKFKNKITHLILKDEINDLNKNENISVKDKRLNSIYRIRDQRNYIKIFWNEFSPEDYIIYSDNDEIPNLDLHNIKKENSKIIIFEQDLYYYKFNLLCDRIKWYGTRAIKKKYLIDFEWLRQIKPKKYSFYRIDTIFKKDKYTNLKILNNGGWHFTRVISPEEIHEKELNAEHHDEYRASNKNPERIKDLIKRRMIDHDHLADSRDNKYGKEFALKQLSLDSMPLYIKENPEKYKEFLDLD